MKRILFILSFHALAFLVGCENAEKEKADQVRAILSAERKLGGDYFRGDAAIAERALRRYLEILAVIEKKTADVDVMRMLHSGRALALTRLEYVKAYSRGSSVNLLQAAEELKRTGVEMSGVDTDKAIYALVEMTKGDSAFVLWVKMVQKKTTKPNQSPQPTLPTGG